VAEIKKVVNDLGVTEYYEDGVLHRDGGPAIIHPDGTQIWMCRGTLHRDGDEPAITRPNGAKHYYKHGERHRNGSPAVMEHFKTEWWANDKLHRDDGPAVIFFGEGPDQWWVNGHQIDLRQLSKLPGWKTLVQEFIDMESVEETHDS
jgi:hypothetical protein